MLRWRDPYTKNWKCRLFGHHWEAGWWGDRPYLQPKSMGTDGIGRKHIRLFCECDRCGESIHVAYVHDWGDLAARENERKANAA